MDWQPIETAPRDGSVILLARPGSWVEAGYWSLATEHPDEDYPWTTLDPDGVGPGGVTNGRLDETYHGPTHWMPLPEPPVEDDDA